MRIIDIISVTDYLNSPLQFSQHESPTKINIHWVDRRRKVHVTSVTKNKLKKVIRDYYNYNNIEVNEFINKRLDFDLYGDFK